MRREDFIAGLLAISATGNSGSRTMDSCDHNDALPYDRQLEITMRVLDGPDFVLSKYLGYAVWINIFATWCGPCQKEQRFMVNTAKQYFDSGLRLIGIDYLEPDNTVRAYREKYGITYPIAMDQRGGFTHALETSQMSVSMHFPSHLFITPRGHLSCFVIGSLSKQEMLYKIGVLLGIPTPQAPPQPGAPPSAQPSAECPAPGA
jgi:thiol-disulfide isomerase/thioredoxin